MNELAGSSEQKSRDRVSRPLFIADCMVGKLARWLRLLGFDVSYYSKIEDDQLIELAEKHKELPDICNAIGAHHDEVEMETLIAPIVQVCDAISGARPGARREVVEAYIQRLNKLEELALSYPGVVKTYAIQAGRELRVIVESEKVTDQYADDLAFMISQKIQDEMQYPGQVKVTVIREKRATAFAR